MEDFLRAWVPLSVSVVTLCTLGWNILTGPAAKNAAALKEVTDALGLLIAKLDGRLDQAEKTIEGHAARLEQVPTNADLHKIEMIVERTGSDVRVMGETLRGVKETSNLMRDWLLEKSVK